MNEQKLIDILKKCGAAILTACLVLNPWTSTEALARVVKVSVANGANVQAVPLAVRTGAIGGGGIAAVGAAIDLKTGTLPRISGLEISPSAQTTLVLPAAPIAPGVSVKTTAVSEETAPKSRVAVSDEMTGMQKEVAALPEAAKTSTGKAYGSGAALEDILTGRKTGRLGDLVHSDYDPSLSEGFSSSRRLSPATDRDRARALAIPMPSALARARSFLTTKQGFALAAAAATLSLIVLQLYIPAIATSLGLIGLTGTLWGGKADPKEEQSPAPELGGASYNTAPDPALQKEIGGMTGTIEALKTEIRRVIVGQEEMVESIIVAMIAGEHILLEGVPGVAKTRTVQAFADATGADFHRIQGTPDKMPADILGAEILQNQADGTRKLVHEKGPIFARVVLFDEINRAMPKTQAALLEAMQERHVTIGNETFDLPKPFLLLATQNPIEQEGTYPLPEAQQDRFMYKIVVPQPSREERKKINALNRTKERVKTEKAVEVDDLLRATQIAERVRLDPALEDYIQDIIDAALDPHSIGIGPEGIVEQAMITRASIYMEKAARIHALMQGRSYVTPKDVRDITPKILRHRIILSYAAADRTTDDLIKEILETLPVPKP